METLAQKLNAKIRLNYHSIREAALQMGVNQSLLSQILKGDKPISAQYAIKIAPYLDISPEESLTLAGHADFVALLSTDIPASKHTLTDPCPAYSVAAHEIAALISPLSDREKQTALAILRTYVQEVSKHETK